jgi:hypothetical protein
MTYTKQIAGALVFLLMATAGSVQAQDRSTWLLSSDIVFDGTVLFVGAVSFYGVPASDKTMMVRIDAVHDQPASVMLAQGDTVTVQAVDPTVFRRNRQATFYTQGWIFGEGVAVREVGHEVNTENAGIARAQDTVPQIRQQQQDAQLRARMMAADMVMVGRVVSVGPSTLAAFQTNTQPISEHTADWREAVIQVDEWIKGNQGDQRIVMRFPTSLDVQWYDAPRFTEGQEGVFICDRDEVSGTAFAMLSGEQKIAYTALSPQDLHPRDQADRLKALLAGQ